MSIIYEYVIYIYAIDLCVYVYNIHTHIYVYKHTCLTAPYLGVIPDLMYEILDSHPLPIPKTAHFTLFIIEVNRKKNHASINLSQTSWGNAWLFLPFSHPTSSHSQIPIVLPSQPSCTPSTFLYFCQHLNASFYHLSLDSVIISWDPLLLFFPHHYLLLLLKTVTVLWFESRHAILISQCFLIQKKGFNFLHDPVCCYWDFLLYLICSDFCHVSLPARVFLLFSGLEWFSPMKVLGSVPQWFRFMLRFDHKNMAFPVIPIKLTVFLSPFTFLCHTYHWLTDWIFVLYAVPIYEISFMEVLICFYCSPHSSLSQHQQ